MTQRSIEEYAAALRRRYHSAGKLDKGKILDEFCETTGHHRKSGIRLLGGEAKKRAEPRGRPRQYATAVVQALKVVWEAEDRMCAKRLVPFLPELVRVLERHGELRLEEEVKAQLLRLSASTADRLLKPYRWALPRRPYTQSGSSIWVKQQIPIRTFGEWAGEGIGSMQMDLVALCGDSTQGFYLNILSGVDVATGWYECQPVWGKGQSRVGGAVHRIKMRLPFALRRLHFDNGGEFINNLLYPWSQREGVKLTRGRPYKKNDQAYVEQKNWSAIRRLVGYDRYNSKAAYAKLEEVCELVRLQQNYFQPLSKLVKKERVGAKVKRHYDEPRTPDRKSTRLNSSHLA